MVEQCEQMDIPMPRPAQDVYATLFDRAPMAVAVLQGEQLRVLYANPTAAAVLGFGGELAGAIAGSVDAGLRGRVRQVLRSGEPMVVREFRGAATAKADGAVSYWDADCVPIDWAGDGRADAVLLMARDVTVQCELRDQAELRAREAERARATLAERERQLAEREEMLRLALEAAQVAAWEYNYETRTIRYVARRERLHRVSDPDYSTTLEDVLDHVHPDDRDALVAAFQQAVEDGQEDLQHEFRGIGAKGEVLWMSSRAHIERDERGRTKRILGVDVDVTAEHTVRERLEQFARTAAHDLRSPLQTIQSFGELLARGGRERLNDNDRDYLRHILDAAKRMDVLIEGLLAHAYAAHANLQREPVDLDGVLDEVLSALKGVIDAAGTVVTRDPLPVVRGHRVLLSQALQNLISNALKFRDESPLQIHVGAQAGDAEWIVSVRDNGLGIPPERQQGLFEAFTRAHAERGVPGLGLGLALVREAVQQHGGRVWLESAPGQGTTFYFSLPIVSD
jgi:signal transduction histidine kinase